MITKLMFDKEKHVLCTVSSEHLHMHLNMFQIHFKQDVNTLRCIVLCARIK